MDAITLTPEEIARANLYALVGNLLLRAPDAALLQSLAESDEMHTQDVQAAPLEDAWRKLCAAASVMDAHAVRDEFAAMFESTGMPRVNPYASLYLAGFMMEKPLAALRADLARLGLARAPGCNELEDHLGALCESMRLLIASGAAGVDAQKPFFDRHIASWYERCLHDIRRDTAANFYRVVAELAQAFLDLEREAFELYAHE